MAVTAVPLIKLRNLGLRSCNWLAEVGIEDYATLKKAGSVDAFYRIKCAGFHPSLNLLYSLEGALRDCHWTDLDETTRNELLTAVNQLQQDAA